MCTVGYGGIVAPEWQLFPVLSSGSPIGAWREPIASEPALGCGPKPFCYSGRLSRSFE